jgi:hypothetical protein
MPRKTSAQANATAHRFIVRFMVRAKQTTAEDQNYIFRSGEKMVMAGSEREFTHIMRSLEHPVDDQLSTGRPHLPGSLV